DVEINGEWLHTLFFANDNDFLANVGGLDNPNQFYVFAFSDRDLPGYAAQTVTSVPEPGSLALLLGSLTLLGGIRLRRDSSR
ncbi:MAG: PEP-CTERM sorting domain-containing protein, partial [Betaproteobacteria bacterium]